MSDNGTWGHPRASCAGKRAERLQKEDSEQGEQDGDGRGNRGGRAAVDHERTLVNSSVANASASIDDGEVLRVSDGYIAVSVRVLLD